MIRINRIAKTALITAIIFSSISIGFFSYLKMKDSSNTKSTISTAINLISNLEPITTSKEVMIEDNNQFTIRGDYKVVVVEFKRHTNPYELADKFIVYKNTGECVSNIHQDYLPSTCSGYVALEDRTITPKQLYRGQGQWANGFDIKDGKLLLNSIEIKQLTYHNRISANTDDVIHFVSVDGADVAVDENGTIIQYWNKEGKTLFYLNDGSVILQEN